MPPGLEALEDLQEDSLLARNAEESNDVVEHTTFVP